MIIGNFSLINIREIIPLPVRRFLHDIGVELLSERNYYYFRSLFIRFYHSFSTKNAAICVLVGMAAFFAVQIFYPKDKYSKGKPFAAAGLSIYGYLLYLYTIAFRPRYSSPQYELELFWSYKRALNGSAYLWIEIILNYILFLPVGLLMPVLIGDKKKKNKKIFAITMLIGFLISLTIEMSQLILQRGLMEWDDLLGNVLGTFFGYGIYRILSQVLNVCRTNYHRLIKKR